jgi:prepilin signal peptidase PulO-like enzyme (type II secretory pathway)
MGATFFWIIIILLAIFTAIFAKNILNFLTVISVIDIHVDSEKQPIINKIRYTSITSIVVALIFISGSQNLVWGFLGILIGTFTIRKSYTIHGWVGSQFEFGPFTGDSLIKLSGIALVLASAFYMSGVTQTALNGFFQAVSGN